MKILNCILIICTCSLASYAQSSDTKKNSSFHATAADSTGTFGATSTESATNTKASAPVVFKAVTTNKKGTRFEATSDRRKLQKVKKDKSKL